MSCVYFVTVSARGKNIIFDYSLCLPVSSLTAGSLKDKPIERKDTHY